MEVWTLQGLGREKMQEEELDGVKPVGPGLQFSPEWQCHSRLDSHF